MKEAGASASSRDVCQAVGGRCQCCWLCGGKVLAPALEAAEGGQACTADGLIGSHSVHLHFLAGLTLGAFDVALETVTALSSFARNSRTSSLKNFLSSSQVQSGADGLGKQHREGTESRMELFGIVGTLALWLCLPSPARGQGTKEIQVSISGNNVTLTCPMQNASWWKNNMGQGENMSSTSQSWTIVNYQGTWNNGRYSCNTNATGIYLQVKECPGCTELDAWMVMCIIAADLLVTLGVLILTYYWSRKQAARTGGGPAAGGPRARPRGQREDRPPPVPNPDYEPIRKGQREVYAGLEPRAFCE